MTAAPPAETNRAAERPVRFVARRDLAVIPLEFRGRRYWHVKDPVSLRYYQLRDEEHFVWGLLNGQRSLREIVALAEARFPPRRLKESQLYGFFALLHREGLVLAVAADQGDRLLESGRRKRRDGLLAMATNPLAIRFRGVNPDRFLTWLNQRLAWLFRPGALAWLIVCLAGAALALIPHWSEFVASVPNADGFFRGDNLLWLAVALALVKIAHELAHGLACKHFSAECTELGLMLLVFTPCLYCNVSDAWTLPNKWQRILVGAAGMLAELALAAAATLVWRWTEPGVVHSLAVRVVLVGSLGTLLLNGNPLLRYDGYYVLADWLEIPNLQVQASDSLRRWAARLLLGIELNAQRLETSAPSPGLALYGLASLLYRIVVLVGIIWFMYSALVHNGFRALGGLFLMFAAGGVLVQAARRASTSMRDPSLWDRLPFTRRSWAAVALAILVVMLLFAPLPCRVSAPAVLRPRDQAAVYAPVAGELISAATEGQTVARGDVLATLSNRELTRELISLTGQRDVQVQQVANLRRRQVADPQLAAELLAAEKTLEAIDAQLLEQKALEERLSIKSPRAGVVIPPPARAADHREGMLSTWSGSPLQRRNRGAFIEPGTLLCYVGDPRHMEAVAVIDPSQVELVQVGQRVKVRLSGGPAVALSGEVAAISAMNLDRAPPELVATGELPDQPTSGRAEPPGKSSYEATIRLEPSTAALLPGVVGRARIDVESQSLWTRLRRWWGQTASTVD